MLNISKLSFPGLGIGEFEVNSVAFTIFGVDIAWYAIFITFGMLCCIAYVIVQSKKIGVTIDDIIDYALFTIPIGVIGARLYYVISEIEQYHSFKDVINIRQGGLAIYGGIIAGTITVFVVSLVKKIDFFAFGDCVAPGVLLAQGIGRWGNFMNGEAFGDRCDLFVRMGVDNYNSFEAFGVAEMVYVHPTFLYESLWNLLGVLLVYLFARFIGKKYDGQLILLTFGWYGLGRMFIEGLRMDSLYIGNTDIRVSQLLAGIIFVTFAIMLVVFAFVKPKRPLYYRAVAEGDKTASNKKAKIDAEEAQTEATDSTEAKEETKENIE